MLNIINYKIIYRFFAYILKELWINWFLYVKNRLKYKMNTKLDI
jgi:hypothetical protein